VSSRCSCAPWKQALQTVITSAGLVQSQENGVLYVHAKGWREEERRAEAEKERRQSALPLSNSSVVLNYADADELAKSGMKLLGKRGSLTVDKRTNRLLVRDDGEHLAAFAAWAHEMDIPVGQVELAAHIVTINETSLRELGIKWSLRMPKEQLERKNNHIKQQSLGRRCHHACRF
jgi:protein transport protein HofQ